MDIKDIKDKLIANLNKDIVECPKCGAEEEDIYDEYDEMEKLFICENCSFQWREQYVVKSFYLPEEGEIIDVH